MEILALKRDFDEAVSAYESGPKAFLVRSREIAEAICKDVYFRQFGDVVWEKSLNQLLGRLSSERIIPQYMMAPLRTLQTYGNVGAHFQGKDAAHITPEYARPSLDSLKRVMDWFLQTYYPDLTTPQAPTIVQQRRIDAALPARAGVNQPLQLCIQVRFPHSPLLGTDDQWPAGQRPEKLEQISERVGLRFPIDPQTGAVCPLTLLFKVNAPDFLMQGDAQKRLEVPPDQESNILSFFLKAQQKGVFQIVIEIYREDEVSLGTIPVAAEIDGQNQTPPVNVVNLFLMIGVAQDTDAVERASAHAPTLPAFHLVIENKAEMQALSQKMLRAIAPQEAPISAGLIDALLNMAANGESVSRTDMLNISGGFRGGKNLMVTTLVPLFINVLTDLLNCLGEFSLADVKQDLAKINACKQAIEQLTPEDILQMAARTGTPLKKKALRQLTDTLKHTLKAYLDE